MPSPGPSGLHFGRAGVVVCSALCKLEYSSLLGCDVVLAVNSYRRCEGYPECPAVGNCYQSKRRNIGESLIVIDTSFACNLLSVLIPNGFTGNRVVSTARLSCTQICNKVLANTLKMLMNTLFACSFVGFCLYEACTLCQ